jgi:hypothetical protein
MAFPGLTGTNPLTGSTNPTFGTTSTNLFGAAAPRPTGTFPGLGQTSQSLGATPTFGTGGSLFHPATSQPTGNLPTFGGLIQHGTNTSTNLVAPSLRPPEYSINAAGRQLEHDYQLIQILNNFSAMNEERHPDYPFKYIMYNRVKDEQKHLVRQFQSYQYSQPNTKSQLIHVTEAEWHESNERNPMPELLYPYQITSWEELNGRLSEYKRTQDMFWKLLTESQTKLNKLRELYTSHIGKLIEERKETNKMLFNKLIMLYGALEKIATRHNRVNKDVPAEMNLGNKLQSIERKIETPELRSVLNDLRSKTQELAIAREGITGGEIMKGMSKENASTILQILKEQRKGIEGIMKMHLQNKHDIEVLSKGMKELVPNVTATQSRLEGLRRDNQMANSMIDYALPVTIKAYPTL